MKNFFKTSLSILALVPFSLNAWIAGDVQDMIGDKSFLLESSNAYLFKDGENVEMIFSHGVAGYADDFEKSKKAAQADAYAQITKILGSTELSASTSISYSENGAGETKNVKSVDTADREMLIGNSQTRGYWIEGDEFHIISCIYLNAPTEALKGDLNEEFFDIKLSDSWVEVLENNRDLWLGGLSVVYNAKEDKYYVIALVSVKDTQPAFKADLVLKTTAIKEVAKYVNGVDFKHKLSLSREVKSTTVGGRENVDIAEKLDDISSEKIAASVKALDNAGSLKHKISKRKYALFVKSLSDM